MNMRLGLTRISAVFWGGVAALCALWGVVLIFTNNSSDWQTGVGALLALIPVYFGHRITCWVVAGFFEAKNP